MGIKTFKPENRKPMENPPNVFPAHKGSIVTLPRHLTTAEIIDYAIRICPKDEFGCVAYEDLEKACDFIKRLNNKLVS